MYLLLAQLLAAQLEKFVFVAQLPDSEVALAVGLSRQLPRDGRVAIPAYTDHVQQRQQRTGQ